MGFPSSAWWWLTMACWVWLLSVVKALTLNSLRCLPFKFFSRVSWWDVDIFWSSLARVEVMVWVQILVIGYLERLLGWVIFKLQCDATLPLLSSCCIFHLCFAFTGKQKRYYQNGKMHKLVVHVWQNSPIHGCGFNFYVFLCMCCYTFTFLATIQALWALLLTC